MLMLPSLLSDQHLQLLPDLVPVHLAHQQVLIWPNEPITHVYFPTTAITSFLALVGYGETIEAGLAARDGMVGVPVLLGATSAPNRCICQVEGDGWRMPVEAFRAAMADGGPLHARLLRYTQAFLTQVGQTAGCNRAHPVEERCARWLLMVHDRVEGDQFHLTHEFLSIMLGVRRATVTVVMGMLHQAGVIEYTRGVVTVRDRPGLEAASCACYGLVAEEFQRLLGAP